ncbi:MAG: ATP-binding protein [Brevinematales bacterium]
MIRRMKLTSFGKFRHASFDFGKTTLFVGPNESGKTTLFDAIALGLCQKGRGGVWDEIQNRYKQGEKKAPLPEMELEDEVVLDYNQFFHFFAVRTGQSEIAFETNKNWVSEMRSRLLFGGYDITAFSRRFQELVFSRKSEAYPVKLEALSNVISRTKDELKGAGDDARTYQSVLENFQQVQRELQAYKKQKDVLQKQRDMYRRELEKIEKSLEAALLRKWLDKYKEYVEKKDELSRRYAALNEKEITEIEQEINRVRDLKEKVKSLEEEVTRWQNGLDGFRSRISFVQSERERVHETYRKTKRKALVWKVAGVTLAIIAIGFLAGMFFFPAVPWYLWFFGGGVGLVFAGLFLVVGMLVGMQRDEDFLRGQMTSLYAEAQRQGFLSGYPKNWEDFLLEIEKQESILAEKKSKIEEQKARLSMEEKTIKKREEDFLVAHHLDSLAVARERLSEKKAKEAELGGLQRGLESFSALEKGLSLEENARAFKDRLSLLPEEDNKETNVLTEQGKKHREMVSKLEKELETLQEKIEEYTRKEVELFATLQRAEENIHKYARLKQEEKQLEEKKAYLEKEKKACEKLFSLFQEIESEQASVFELLSSQVKEEFGDVYPAFQDIQLKGFQKEGILFSDALGEKRPVKFLSQGTQDLFYLALRLFLGQRMWKNFKQPGVFVFDEPFASLDEERKQVALRLLQKFQKKYGWQYVIFTKDESLPYLMQKEAWEMVVYHLDRDKKS